MLARVLAVIPCLIITWSSVVSADVLVLRDGRKLDGILSNSALVQEHPATFRQISFLVGSGPDAALQRFNTSEIEWILIEDATGVSVIDFTQLSYGAQPFDRDRNFTPVVERGPERKATVHLEMKGGVTWAQFLGKGSEQYHHFRQGKIAGINLTMLQGPYGGASLGAFYVQKGAVGRTAAEQGRVAELEYRMDYVEVPVCIVGRIPVGNGAIRASAGPTLAFPVSTKVVGEGWAYFGQPELDVERDISGSNNELEVGLRLGVGLELPLSPRTSLLLEGAYGRTFSQFRGEGLQSQWTHAVLSAEVGLSIALSDDDESVDRRSRGSRPRWERP